MNKSELAVLAGGCFWCTEAVFAALKGVTAVVPGYTGGEKAAPSYEEVSSGRTGHAEAIEIEYDPAVISFDDLLAVFFHTHNPTTLNRQGNDTGTQYRSAIFYTSEAQKEAAEKLIQELSEAKAYEQKIVTEVKPLTKFYPAEDYHRDYYAQHRTENYCELVIEPKLEKLRAQFARLLKDGPTS